MTLAKAIEIGTYHRAELDAHTDADTQYAIKLLIKAGKRCQENRIKLGFPHTMLLPGETKE